MSAYKVDTNWIEENPEQSEYEVDTDWVENNSTDPKHRRAKTVIV